jgi:hypothetical protein
VRSGPAAPAHPRTAAEAPAARTAARTLRRSRPHSASGPRPGPGSPALRGHHPGRHHRGTHIGLGHHPTRLRLGDPHPEGAGPPAGGHLEAVHGTGIHPALLDPELRERRRQEVLMVAGRSRRCSGRSPRPAPPSPARPPPANSLTWPPRPRRRAGSRWCPPRPG